MIRNLLSIRDLTPEQIERIMETASAFQSEGPRIVKKYPTLVGKTVVNLFYESSTRTRTSFELAAKRLSADVVTFAVTGSAVEKGESLKDTAQTIEAMGVDAIVIRHGSSGAPHRLASWVSAAVVNAGDGMHEHPTQALLDLYTIRQRFPSLDGLRIAIVGDVLHSRVARSNVWGMQMMGAEVSIVAPRTLLPPKVETWGAEVTHDLDAVLPKADVVYLLRMQLERMRVGFVPSLREFSRLWGLDADRAAMMKDEALIMHPGPMNRGVEITGFAADLPRAVITDQVANGIAVRMALLYLMLGGPQVAATPPEAPDA